MLGVIMNWKIYLRGFTAGSFVKEIDNTIPRIPVVGEFIFRDGNRYIVESVIWFTEDKEIELNIKKL